MWTDQGVDIIKQVRPGECAPVWQHLQESFALQLNVDITEMIDTTTNDLKTLSLVDSVQPRQPVEQLRSEPTAISHPIT